MATVIPANRAPFTVDEVLAVTGGTLVRRGPADAALGVSTDTRRLQSGDLFVALRGANFEGHEFLQAASQAGASMFLLSQHVLPAGQASVIRVPDTLEALGKLGRAHRARWARAVRKAGGRGQVIAITGSAGKTTTSRAVTAVLKALAPGQVHAAAGNMNNQIGMPLVLLGAEAQHRYVVVEVGTNSPGEIAYGAWLTQPDVGVLTLVACAHGEGLGTIEDIAREKGALLERVRESGASVANADDLRARAQLLRTRARRSYTYGFDDEADVRIVEREPGGLQSQRVRLEVATATGPRTLEANTSVLGEAGAYASAAAVAVALAVSRGRVDLERVRAGLEAVQAEEGRLRPRQLASGLVVIDDAYNANPASMTASIHAASEIARAMSRPLVLVLGEMRELGMQGLLEHERLGRVAAESGAERIVAVAGTAVELARAAESLGARAAFVSDAEAAVPVVLQAVSGREVVLVKGSRGVALERVVAALEAKED
jgi:UDP-N-acetylmuramoyl-tripeptide--D-alanyl-D-alanine ligase